ncbi:MAG TPA: hypothetical protein ACFYEK_03715 [Candidatus Wunengus sp. YC60]|uniref:hypothetical protein n=1 Tax=Candidatus Wunengus sp. YC60 TaxID=3367697 RepID=UPI004024D48B
MNFTPRQHLEIDNHIKFVDEILHKCDKGIEYCKICPNEFVCTELEKEDFGLNNSTISEVLTAIQYALSKVPGFLNLDKRNELREHIKSYINESPVHERKIWEDSILDLLLDDKLANPLYKPAAKIGEVRTLLTYNSRISFSTSLKCLCPENKDILSGFTRNLPPEISSACVKIVNQYIQAKHTDITIPQAMDRIIFYLEKNVPEITQGCNLNDAGLAAALCYYAMLTKTLIPEHIAITGGLDNQGRTLQADSLDGKIETVLRELHFVDKIIIPNGSLCSIPVPGNVRIIKVDSFEQAVYVVFKNDIAI